MKYFGTDGVRGTFGSEYVCAEFFEKLGRAVGAYLSCDLKLENPKIAIGSDTRYSKDALKAAFCKGLGKSLVLDFGVVPTPAIAYGVLHFNCDLGVVITASHNPYTDNGIKFFDNRAKKISDEAQDKIEQYVDENRFAEGSAKIEAADAKTAYINKMTSILPSGCLSGVKIALDCANGATYCTTKPVLEMYGASITAIGVWPNGKNINDNIGSQHPEKIAELTKSSNSIIGFAHDGDGDRLVVCDDLGNIISGEEIMAMIAVSEYGEKGGKIVTTVQSNLGLDSSLEKRNIKVFRSGVGDRLVAQLMAKENCKIGGENSGHFIFEDISPCGDGLAAALKVLSLVLATKQPLSKSQKIVDMFDSVSKAIKVARKTPFEQTKTLNGAMQTCRDMLGNFGRILVRYSGTENKIRLLVEGKTPETNLKCMEILEKSVENDLQ